MPFPPRFPLVTLFVAALVSTFFGQTIPLQPMVQIPLVVPAGTPLRLEVEQTTFPKRIGDAIRARLTESICAFDQEVIPAGTEVIGHVTSFNRDAKGLRAKKMLSGNFGSFRHAQIQFDTVLQRDRKPMTILASTESGGSRVVEMRASSAGNSRHGVHGLVDRGKQEARTQIKGARAFLANPRKFEMLRDAALSHSPYQPLAIGSRAGFVATLTTPENFGSESIPAAQISQLGKVAPQSGELRADLLTPLNSGTTQPNEPVDAVVMSPLFSPEHRLILPVGSHLIARAMISHPSRRTHKIGQLRITFAHA